jgi:CubicO group peptidase (beta-lactamase class C family)
VLLRLVPPQGGFGSKVSGGAFGHDGAGGQIAWGDPATGISMAFVHNTFGPEANPGRVARDMEISDLAATCGKAAGAKL